MTEELRYNMFPFMNSTVYFTRSKNIQVRQPDKLGFESISVFNAFPQGDCAHNDYITVCLPTVRKS